MNVTVDDVRILYPGFESLYARVHFWNHASTDASRFDRTLGLSERHAGDDRLGVARVALNAVDVGQGDKLAGHKRRGYVSRDGVSIEIEAVTRAIDGDGGYHRDVSLAGHNHKDLWVDDFGLADPAKVNLAFDAFIYDALGAFFPSGDHAAIFSGQAYPFAAVLADQCYKTRIDVPDEDHAGDFEGLFVSDTQACCKFGLFAHSLHLLADFRSASVNEHWLHTNVTQEHDVFDNTLHEALVDHRVPANFDNDERSVKLANVRQRFDKDLLPLH